MDENLNLNGNAEIEKALKEFEAQDNRADNNNFEQNKQTEQIDHIYSVSSSLQKNETSKMIQWVMKLSGGAIKDEKQANYALLGLALLATMISLYLFFGI